MLSLRLVMWSFYFPRRKYLCAIWRHGISTNIGDSYGINCAPLIEDLFIYCYERDCMSNLHNSKQYFLKTCLTIPLVDNPEFEKHIIDIYPMEQNKYFRQGKYFI